MLFVIDFDGTLSTRDTVDALLEQFAPPSWMTVEQAWLDGRISAVQCMKEQLQMVSADRPALDLFFRQIELDASFLSFYQFVSRNAQIVIVSDGLDHAIHTAMNASGFPRLPVYANQLHFTATGLDISWPHLNSACQAGNGVCKCAMADQLAAPEARIVLVGDGKSDACLAAKADVVFAKGSLIRHCETHNIAHHKFNTFADVLAAVRTWDGFATPCHA